MAAELLVLLIVTELSESKPTPNIMRRNISSKVVTKAKPFLKQPLIASGDNDEQGTLDEMGFLITLGKPARDGNVTRYL